MDIRIIYLIRTKYYDFVFRWPWTVHFTSCTPEWELCRISKYQVSYKYSYSSWWWTWKSPKHVEVLNNIDETYWKYCAPSWFHLLENILSYIGARTHKDSWILTNVFVAVRFTVCPKKPQTASFLLFAGCQMCFAWRMIMTLPYVYNGYCIM